MTDKKLTDITVRELLELIEQSSGSERQASEAARGDDLPVGSHAGRMIPVTEWSKYHSWPPIGGLRWLIYNEKQNSFDKVVKRAGRRCLIDEIAFFEWLRSGAGKSPSAASGSGRGEHSQQGLKRKPGRAKRNS